MYRYRRGLIFEGFHGAVSRESNISVKGPIGPELSRMLKLCEHQTTKSPRPFPSPSGDPVGAEIHFEARFGAPRGRLKQRRLPSVPSTQPEVPTLSKS
jgi:hypothetical protein